MLELNKIYNEDCLNGMRSIDSDSISNCITDPPYSYDFIGKEWDDKEINRILDMTKKTKTLVTNIPYSGKTSSGTRNANWYKKNRANILEYTEWTKEWGKEVFRVLKYGGFCFVFNNVRNIAHVQVAMEEVGFFTKDIIVWKRQSGIPRGLNVYDKLKREEYEGFERWEGWKSTLMNEWEGILIFQKPLKKGYVDVVKNNDLGIFNLKQEDGGCRSNIIEGVKRDKKDEFNSHVTVKPTSLIKELIQICTQPDNKHVILDPFMGSGTTGVCCRELGIDFIGFEINPDYSEIANKRLDMINK